MSILMMLPFGWGGYRPLPISCLKEFHFRVTRFCTFIFSTRIIVSSRICTKNWSHILPMGDVDSFGIFVDQDFGRLLAVLKVLAFDLVIHDVQGRELTWKTFSHDVLPDLGEFA